MKSLIYYTPGRFKSISHYPDVKIWLAMFNIFNDNISFIDRTGTITAPVRTATLDQIKIPDIDQNFNLSFVDCAVDRAKEIYAKHRELQVPIKISWSGGIDSSVALLSFIDLLGVSEAKKCVEVVMTSHSIVENPYVWENIVRKENFKIINALQFDDQWDGSSIMVNGEGGDQIHGADIFRSLIRLYGPQSLTAPWNTDDIINFVKFRTNLTDVECKKLSEILIEQVKNSPIQVTTSSDFWWWLNFSCKWASTFYRLITKSSKKIDNNYIDNYFFPFYNSKPFQLWSMLNQNEKHRGDWVLYKTVAKEYVCRVIGSQQFMYKHRQGSLTNLLSHTARFEAIDSDFEFYDKIDAESWYESNNSFRI